MVEEDTPTLPERETGNKIQRWEYDTRFKHYLYRIGILGNEGTEPISEFPPRIELDDAWHKTLNSMREASRDGYERSIPVGYREDRRNLHLPQEFSLGTTFDSYKPNPQETKEEFGIEYQAGFIHSHPNDPLSRFGWKALEASKLADGSGFSLGDMYFMLDGHGLPMEAVVEKDQNYFAFRTNETKDIPDDSPLHTVTAFTNHWYRKNGIIPAFNGNLVVAIKIPYSVRKMDLDVAKAYNLALYSGKPNEDLVRIFPGVI